MAITNLHLVKLNGKPVQKSDLFIGMRAQIPSGAGGMVEALLVSMDDSEAVFKSTNRHWPVELDVLFNVPDLTDEEFGRLPDAIANFNKLAASQATYRALVHKAARLGYAVVQSYTQCSLTEAGASRCSALQKAS